MSPGGRTRPSGRGWCRPARPSLLSCRLPPLLFLCLSPRRLLGPPGHSPVALCLLSRERRPSRFPRGITSSLPQADRFPRGISLNRTHAHSRSSSRGARRSAASGAGRFLGARTVEAEGAGGHRAGPAGWRPRARLPRSLAQTCDLGARGAEGCTGVTWRWPVAAQRPAHVAWRHLRASGALSEHTGTSVPGGQQKIMTCLNNKPIK